MDSYSITYIKVSSTETSGKYGCRNVFITCVMFLTQKEISSIRNKKLPRKKMVKL